MEINKVQWRMIAKGEKLPCDSFLMKKDGTIISMATGAGVTVGQDAYYLPVEELRFFPKEESEGERMIQYFKDLAPFDKADELYEKYGFSHKDAIVWLEKQGEQKHAWSEEDNQMIENIIDYLKPMPIFYETTTGRSGKEYTRKFVTEAIEFLKSLQPRSKNKCSAKDKEMILGLLSFISLHGSLVEGGIDEWYDWLKELEERLRGVQNHWKPSDEQIYALRSVVTELKHGDNKYQETIEDLYNDLKRLREE